MLVLTRRVGEEILIGSDIRLMVAAIKGKSVRLGIAAPPSIRVVRCELLAEQPQVQLNEGTGENGRISGHGGRPARRRREPRT